MSFNEPVFLFIFLPLLLAVYFLVPNSRPAWREGVLLLASLIFYVWGGKQFLGVLLAATLVNYALGRAIEAARATPRGKRLIILGVALNLGLLVAFKYTRFVVVNLNDVLAAFHANKLTLPDLLVPLGISFFTFHAIGYLVDIHRGEAPAERSLPRLALYLLFFPKVIAGPITRYAAPAPAPGKPAPQKPVLPASQIPPHESIETFARGVRRFAIGLTKKVVLSAAFATPADKIFGLPPGELTPALAWLGLVSYTLQIYFDFSGYTDMAIGVAALFGRTLPENFDYPYIAQSIREFWRRWHLSLSTWLRDYLYIPLGGSRVSTFRVYANLVIVFLLCGIWHGAGWPFLVWGAYHGLFLVLERLGLGKVMDSAWRPLRHLYALLAVMVGWVFFRANDLHHAFAFLAAMLGLSPAPDAAHLPDGPGAYIDNFFLVALVASIIGATPIVPAVLAWRDRLTAADAAGRPSRFRPAWDALGVAIVAALLFLSGLFIAASTYSPFIYRQF
ncbi:MAG: MBOAT family protein [Planctomycetota bacterium]|nr:MBOAT family protein [Planctomycetota bacterium]